MVEISPAAEMKRIELLFLFAKRREVDAGWVNERCSPQTHRHTTTKPPEPSNATPCGDQSSALVAGPSSPAAPCTPYEPKKQRIGIIALRVAIRRCIAPIATPHLRPDKQHQRR